MTTTEIATEKCPCGEGPGGGKWHARRAQDTCAGAKEAKKIYDRDRHKRVGHKPRVPRKSRAAARSPRWIPGTDIEVPEVDPL